MGGKAGLGWQRASVSEMLELFLKKGVFFIIRKINRPKPLTCQLPFGPPSLPQKGFPCSLHTLLSGSAEFPVPSHAWLSHLPGRSLLTSPPPYTSRLSLPAHNIHSQIPDPRARLVLCLDVLRVQCRSGQCSGLSEHKWT